MAAENNNTIVIIPSFNEAKTIGGLVSGLVDRGMRVLVIDDGSTDNTENVALDSGAMVIRHKTNLGKGRAIREGIKYVSEEASYEWMILMDGDGQHHIEDIGAFMDKTRREEVDIVVGNRMHDTKDMPMVRFWTNRFTSWVTSRICRQNIPDSQCGYRLVKVSSLKCLELASAKYDIESEMLIQAAFRGMKISSVNVQTIYGDEQSAINPLRDTIRFFALIFKYRFTGYHKKS